jgi:hypothetical protein
MNTQVLALAVLLAAPAARADPPAVRISIEADPLDFTVYKGWSVFSVIRPAAFGPWAIRFGTGVAYLPKLFTETGGNTGWTFGFDPVTTIGVERYFGGGRGGFFLLGAPGYARMLFTGPSRGKVSISAASVQLSAGYRWYPSADLGLVITVDAGAVSSFYRSEDPVVDGQKFEVPIASPIAELFVGWDFDIGAR